MACTNDPPSQEDTGLGLARPDVADGTEPVDVGKTASSTSSATPVIPALASTDSAPSERVSMRSHTSIPVVGTYPLGSLRVHTAMDSPRPQRPGPAEPQPDTPDMPPLDGEEEPATAGSHNNNDGGDIFLLLDLPSNSTVGCDTQALSTATATGTPSFQGFRDIPPGPHFLWVSEPHAMSRCGYWFVTTPQRQQVRVKQWDKFNEVLVTPPSNFEVRDLRDNVASLYPQLVSYGVAAASSSSPLPPPSQRHRRAGHPGGGEGDGGGGGGGDDDDDDDDDDAARQWKRLTACISERLLARVTGKPEKAGSHGGGDGGGEWLVDTSDSAVGDGTGFLPAKTTQTYQTLVGIGELHFLFPEGDVDVHAATARGTTDVVPDTSMDILRLLDAPGAGVTDTDLLGELQFTFLTGLHLSNLACLEQWWHLVLRIVLRAHQLVLLRPSLSHAFLTTLHSQMVYNERFISPHHHHHHHHHHHAPVEDGESPRHEYGGAGGVTTSLLDVIPGNKRKLREALTLFKRRMDELLLGPPGGRVTLEQGEAGRAFVKVEEWFWKLGWDLRTGYVKKEKDGEDGEDGEADGMGYDEDDEYRPVIVDLDDHGREIGLVLFT